MHDHFTARVVTTYCLCDDFLRAWGHADNPQAKMTTAEVMTVALVAAASLGGNHRLAGLILSQHGYLRRALSPGRLSRRLRGDPAGPVRPAGRGAPADEPGPGVRGGQHARARVR